MGAQGSSSGAVGIGHNFEDALRAAGIVGTMEAAVLAGRKRGSDATAAAYGNGYQMGRLLERLALVRYPGLVRSGADCLKTPLEVADS